VATELKLKDIKDLLKTELAAGLAAEREYTAAMFAAEREHMDGRFDEMLTATAEVISSVNDHVDKRFDRLDRVVGAHSKDIAELRSHLA
jgi:hypothetical protein